MSTVFPSDFDMYLAEIIKELFTQLIHETLHGYLPEMKEDCLVSRVQRTGLFLTKRTISKYQQIFFCEKHKKGSLSQFLYNLILKNMNPTTSFLYLQDNGHLFDELSALGIKGGCTSVWRF